MPEPLNEFYAVTMTSIYHVQGNAGSVSAIKIALKGTSRVSVGFDLTKGHGGMIAICDCLQAYIPEGGGMTSLERRIENVNTRYWGAHSSPIVALFKDKKAAEECLDEDGKECDARWFESTKEVLAEIGDDHPFFYICRNPSMSLMQEA